MNNPFHHPLQKGLIGIFNDSFPPILDGVTLTVENYAHWLSQTGQTPVVVTPWNPIQVGKPYDVMRFFSLPIRNRHPYRYGYPKLDPFIWSRLRNTDFKLVHAHCPFSSGRLAVYVKKHQRVPLIGTFHSKYRQDLEHSFRATPWFVPIIMKRILKFFNACDEVWIPQAYVEDTVREYGYRGPLQVVENGNDFASIITGDLQQYKSEARKRLGLDDGSINLLFVGQHIWEKGLDVILETLRLIKGKENFRMNFIGTGYAWNDISKRVKEMGLADRVTLHGNVKERESLAEYYAASHLFLFPSFYDNAPLVVREAAAMGTPSILLEGSTAAEVISDGRNGFLAKNNSKDFADTIMYLSSHHDKLDEVALSAKNTLVRSWQDVVEEVSDRYSAILRNRR